MNTDGLSVPASASNQPHIVLVGGGHTHALMLRHWTMQPSKKPKGLITLVSANSSTLYSGLIPSLLTGQISPIETSINIRTLADQAGVHFIRAEALSIDLNAKTLQLKDRNALRFDLLGLNLGAVTRRQGFRNAIAIKPLDPALKAIRAQDALANNPDTHPFHCVGAGLAAIEIALALRQRWPQRPLILHIGGRSLQPSMVRELLQADIKLSDNAAPDTANTLLCTGSEAPSWLAESGLACDTNGRVLTRSTLQALDHPEIFASGDCAVIQGMERPPSGVWAVRAAQPLASNLEQISRGQTPQPWRPQRRALQLLDSPSVPAGKPGCFGATPSSGPIPGFGAGNINLTTTSWNASGPRPP